jgi:hypothetical protein
MPAGVYDRSHIKCKKHNEELNPTFCRCGSQWGKHITDWSVDGMKLDCVACGIEIGVYKQKMFIPNQCVVRYKEKGNYCDKCNNKSNKNKKCNLAFFELFKNKPK